MKRLIPLLLAALPLFAFGVNIILADYEYYDDGYDYDEYWCDYPYDGYWVYYPDGYYCVHYVWWYPWWWDWYWWRCHWCHHFCWDFFYCGFYVVWYEDGYWWWRPRYGRWVRYRLPYTYKELRYRAKKHGIILPRKPPREVNIPYKENRIKELIRRKDPELFARVQKEHKSGNLERMRKEYDTKIRKKFSVMNKDNPREHSHREIKSSKNNLVHTKFSEDIVMPDRNNKKLSAVEKRSGIHIVKKKRIKETDVDNVNYENKKKDSQFDHRRSPMKKWNNKGQENSRFDRDRERYPGPGHYNKKEHSNHRER